MIAIIIALEIYARANGKHKLHLTNHETLINSVPPNKTYQYKLTQSANTIESPQIKEQETTVNVEPVKEFGSVELRCVG